jgi:hypothetical protein
MADTTENLVEEANRAGSQVAMGDGTAALRSSHSARGVFTS